MSKLLKSLAAASAFACLAASSAALAQSSPPLEPPAPSPYESGAPQITDATKTRLVGVALPPEPILGWNRTLMTFADGVAVLYMRGEGFFDGQWVENIMGVDLGAYYSAPNCSGSPLMRVQYFPNYGKFIPDAVNNAGYSQAGLVLYPSRPFSKATLVAQRLDGRCKALSRPIPDAFVGVLARARVRAHKLPFFTK